jgi:hypothetical protein
MVGDVACMGEMRNVYKILVVENLKGRHHLGYLYFDRRTLLRFLCLWVGSRGTQ